MRTETKKNRNPFSIDCFQEKRVALESNSHEPLAGVTGFEPVQTVLETVVLPLTPYP